MKKTIILVLISFVNTFGQDIIIKNDKTEIKAKIEELTETTIKYKKFDMLDGPIYNINKRDVFMVIYKNGSKEYMETNIAPQPTVVQNTNSSINNTTPQNTTSPNSQNANISFPAGQHTVMTKISKNKYQFEGQIINLAGYDTRPYSKYGYTDLVTRTKNSLYVSFISYPPLFAGIIVGFTGRTLLSLALTGIAIVPMVVSKSMRNGVVNDFNSRATIKVGSNTKIKLSPILYSSNTGTNAGVSIGF